MFRLLLICLLSLSCLRNFAQDTLYYKEPAKKTRNFKKCDYLVVTDKSDPLGMRLTKFSKEGLRLMELFTTDSHADFAGLDPKEGRVRIWYASGQLKSQAHYQAGKLERQLITYWPNGQIKRNDFFQHDSCIAGKCFDSTGSEVAHFPYRIMPRFPGGADNLNLFLAKNIKYPESDHRTGKEGKVLVRFVVNTQGAVENIHIIRSPSPDMSQEVVRLLTQQMPRWLPGKIDGEAIKVYYTLPVIFRLK